MNNIDLLLDYIRLISYGAVIISAIQGISKKKFSSIYFYGDVVIAVGLLLAGILTNIFHKEGRLFADIILTPAAVIWGFLHIRQMVNNLDKETENK